MAGFFAGKGGRIYLGLPAKWSPTGVRHRSRKELLQLLRGTGKGDAKWASAYEVMRARQYVEEWQEHLADFTSVSTMDETELRHLVDRLFTAS